MTGIILIDKPGGWTSHDVVAKLRGILHERRIGHSGTLDPMATGLLVVFAGRATRAVQFAENHEKEYIAGIKLGVVTDTYDTTGSILEKREASITAGALDRVLERFRGEINQYPPMYSAVKVDGKKLYEYARKGRRVELQPRKVTIHRLERAGADEKGDEFTLDIRCSKGTYVRSLCHDIGAALGSGGAMSSLRRTSAGIFSVKDAHTLEEVAAASENGRVQELLLPVDSIFSDLPRFEAGQYEEKKCRTGTAFKAGVPDGDYRVYSGSGEFLMLARAKAEKMNTIKSFFEV